MAKVNGKYLNDIAGDLPQALQDEYSTVKDFYREYMEVRKGFEDKVREHLGCDDLVFSYRFGQLSCSVGEPKAEKVSKPKINLAQWLEQQR